MKVKTNIQAGVPGNFVDGAQQVVASAVRAVTENPVLQSATNAVADVAKTLWFWPFPVH